MKKSIFATLSLAAFVFAGLAQSEDPNINNLDIQEFATQVDIESTISHLEKLQEIATANNGTRAAGTDGYKLSSHYIAMQLIDAGYEVTLEPFQFDMFEKVSPSVFKKTSPEEVIYEEEETFNTFGYSASGDITALTQAVDLALGDGNASTSGCEAEDFADFVAGRIAVIQRGSCTFLSKAQNALAAGAVGVVIFNQGNEESRKELLAGTLSADAPAIPVFGTSYDLGVELATEGTELHMFADTVAETKNTHNVIAETPGGNPNKIVMIGSHLDSVGEGPGINDNGTGSAAILSVALRMKDITPNNKVRFAWWGAEEHGLVGSRHYSRELSDEEVSKISLYLNFDMVGSPNYILGVYDSDGSEHEVPGPAGSKAIEKIFHDYFTFLGLPTIQTEANGRSDYVGFAERGVPFGGSFTGAEVEKTEEQAALFGGTAGESYDKCYHKECDTIDNVNREALEANLKMITFATLSYARSVHDIEEEQSGQGELFPRAERVQPRFNPAGYPVHFERRRFPVWAQ